jgi:hypothetical protein
MKYLIVGGDSFSDKNFRSTDHPDLDTSWPKWPEMLAEKLGMKCINLAVGGKGNEFIYSTIQDQILSMHNKDEIGLVVAAWSQAQRRDWQLGQYDTNDNEISIPTRNWREDKIDVRGDLLYFIRRSLRYYSAFEILCKRYDIPYMHFQMIDMYTEYLHGRFKGQSAGSVNCSESEILKIIMKYDTTLDTSKFIGWPCTEALGGSPLNRIVFGEHNMNQFVISEEDSHPNADGQVVIADYIYNNMHIV